MSLAKGTVGTDVEGIAVNEGAREGNRDEGNEVKALEGIIEGAREGEELGAVEGDLEGCFVGSFVGACEGAEDDGAIDCRYVGRWLGDLELVGRLLGFRLKVGRLEGSFVDGLYDGLREGLLVVGIAVLGCNVVLADG